MRWYTPSRDWYVCLSVWIPNKTLLLFDILLLSVWISDKTLLVFDTLLLDVWISDKTLLAFDILLLDVWISDETLLAFDILLLVIWISNETLLTFDTLFLRARISDKTLFVFQWYITSRCLDITLNTLLVFDQLLCSAWKSDWHTSCLMYYFSMFGYQIKHSFSCLTYLTRCLDI